MLMSMTGYGRAKGEFQGRNYIIDIKTLNGKTTDIRTRLPSFLRTKEIELRKHIMDRLERGKMDVSITASSDEESLDVGLNMKLIEKYYLDLSALVTKYGLKDQDFLQTIIRIPNVIETKEDEIEKAEYTFVIGLLDQAIADLLSFRRDEGDALKKDLVNKVKAIVRFLDMVEVHEEERKKELIERLNRLIAENITVDSIDENRLEQETIYYLEKLDIHEEKIRLTQHCEFFLTEVESGESQIGKKLSFISQEMGREINTLGAKAQYSSIQQIVVEMKVELDQVREQLANVL